MSKENFKRFVKSNPNIIDYVKENNAKWQDLYEVYELYGEDENVWSKYVNTKTSSIEELVGIIKGINMDSVKKTIDGLQKAVNLLQEINGGNRNIESYTKSPKYEDLDD